MAELATVLSKLDADPQHAEAWDELVAASPRLVSDGAAVALIADARGKLLAAGHALAGLRLLDLELDALARGGGDPARRAELLVEKAMVLQDELADAAGALACLDDALALRPGDELADEARRDLVEQGANWRKLATRYAQEAAASSDRQLATTMYLSAASLVARYEPAAPEIEAHLRAALAGDPSSRRAASRLERLLSAAGRDGDRVALLRERADGAPSPAERAQASVALAAALASAGDAAGATEALRAAIAIDPAHPVAVRLLAAEFEARRDWAGRVALYQGALGARRGADDPALLLALGSILWRDLGDEEQAEEYFRRLRKLDPAQPTMIDFYRAYYTARGDSGKLMTLLKTAERAGGGSGPTPAAGGAASGDARARAIATEIAELADEQARSGDRAAAEKAIEAWKQVLRAEPTSPQARAALQRLYRVTEKWNALLDLLKEELDRLPDDAAHKADKVERLFAMIEIYRDRLKLDGMVVGTYGTLLRVDPENLRAMDELAERFRGLSRWNDLITTLARKAELESVPVATRVALLREVADLWIERFSNFAQAIRPLERVLELAGPGDPARGEALTRLKDIHTRRRQWRPLIALLGVEAESQRGDERGHKLAEMARLAMERVGDLKLAVELWNRALVDVAAGVASAAVVGDALAALAGLYERDKRWLALAEVQAQQAARAASDAERVALLEKQGATLTDRLGAAGGPAVAALAAEVWQAVLAIDPAHARALRTLREALAAAGDFDGLEALYLRLGHTDELVETLVSLADRNDAPAVRTALLERAARLAVARAEAPGARGDATERAVRVWERLVALDASHLGAALALAPFYEKHEKWSRLVPALEAQLQHAREPAERLALMRRLAALCEQRLGSRGMAYGWAARAVGLAPASAEVRADMLRLAHDPDSVRDAMARLDAVLADQTLAAADRQAILGELEVAASTRAGDPERARGYLRQLLDGATPGDAVHAHAQRRLEEVAIQLADWPALVGSLRARADAAAGQGDDEAARWVDVALAEEERLVDLDAAAITYARALATATPGGAVHQQAVRAQVRLSEARGDWAALARALDVQLQHEPEATRAALQLRIGTLLERDLRDDAGAVPYFQPALATLLAAGDPAAVTARGDGAAALAALDRAMSNVTIALELRVAIARQLLPVFEARREAPGVARCLELVRGASADAPDEHLAIDRRLLALYIKGAPDPAAAWTVARRLLIAAPGDADVRRTLDRLSSHLGRDGELVEALATAQQALAAAGAPPDEQRALAAERARLLATRLADAAGAEAAWRAVLAIQADDDEAFDALAAMQRSGSRWPELRALLQQRMDVTLDERTRRACAIELATLAEDVVGNPEAAIAAHRRVLELEPGHVASHAALDRLLSAAGRWRELDELLAVEQDGIEEGSALRATGPAVELRFRRAELHASKLGDLDGALDLIDEVLARQPTHPGARALLNGALTEPAQRVRAARTLEPIYKREQRSPDLARVLAVQLDAARADGDDDLTFDLTVRSAELAEDELADAGAALGHWLAALVQRPADERARGAVPRLAGVLGRWPEATAAMAAALPRVAPEDSATRIALLTDLAGYLDEQQDDADGAIAAYQQLLAVDGLAPDDSRQATAALARLLDGKRDYVGLREVLRRRAAWIDAPAERRTLLGRIAELEETQLADRAAAVTTWREVLIENPDDGEARAALERLLIAGERWPELVEHLRQQLDESPTRAKELLARIAGLTERELGQPDEAISTYLELLDRVADDPDTLTELARLYRAAGRHGDLLDIQERRLATSPLGLAERIALQVDCATLLDGPLGRSSEGLERWGEVLALDTRHPEALAAVQAALGDPDRRARATELLTPVFEGAGDQASLEQLEVRTAQAADDPRSRMLAWQAVAQRRERGLGDAAGAFAAAGQALRAAVAEPEAPQLVAHVERLAAVIDREADLIDLYRDLAPDVLDAELQRRLQLDIADLARGVRGDVALAREYYQRVLDGRPDDRRALLAVESIYRSGDGAGGAGRDDGKLYEVLIRKSEMDWASDDERVAALAEAATLAEGPLGRDVDAALAWEQVLEAEPQRRDAGEALERVYRRMGRHNDLVELYERRLGFAASVEEAVALRVTLAELQLTELRDPAAAIDSYGAALSGDPNHARALAAVEGLLDEASVRAEAADLLEPIYVARQAWPQLIRVYEVKLEAATEPAERLRLTRFLARLNEEQLEDLEQASRWYARLFREVPHDVGVREQLGRLANIVENWAFVAGTYQALLDDEPGLGPDSDDGPGAVVRDVATAAATMYERRLGDVEKAQLAYRRAMAIPTDRRAFGVPDQAELLARLEALLTRAERHATLAEVYDEALGLAADAGDDLTRFALLAKKARLLEAHLADPARAVETWRELSQSAGEATDARAQPSYLEAVVELERLYRARAQWFDLCELLTARIERVSGATDAVVDEIALRLRLATVLETEQKDLTAAIDQLELVLGLRGGVDQALPQLERLVVEADHRQRIVELLEPVYRAKDWWQKLVVILDAKLAYVDERDARVALLREIARLHERRGGDRGLARAALARAWREDVSDGELLRELIDLAGAHEAWDELVATLEQGVATSYDPEVVGTVWSRIAGIHEARREDLPAAIAAWRKALEARSDDSFALAALDRLLALTGRTSELVEVVERRAELAHDAGIRLVLLHRAAALYEEVLARPVDAIGAYRRVLELDDADGAALDGLDRLFDQGPSADPHELATTLARKIELATAPDERRTLRLRLADVHETRRRDDYEAVAQLTAVLDEDARDPDALVALERIYRRLRSWPELLDVIDRRTLAAPAGAPRAELLVAAAMLLEQELSDVDAAIQRYGAVLQLVPTHAGARDALWRLADRDDLAPAATEVLERTYRAGREADGLVRVHERRLRLPADEPGARRSEWSALADVHETMRGDTRAAFDTWARAMADDADELELLGPLERLAGLDDRWADLAAVLDGRVAAARGRGDAEAEHTLAMRLGAVHEDARGDAAAAIAAYERAAGGRRGRARGAGGAGTGRGARRGLAAAPRRAGAAGRGGRHRRGGRRLLVPAGRPVRAAARRPGRGRGRLPRRPGAGGRPRRRAGGVAPPPAPRPAGGRGRPRDRRDGPRAVGRGCGRPRGAGDGAAGPTRPGVGAARSGGAGAAPHRARQRAAGRQGPRARLRPGLAGRRSILGRGADRGARPGGGARRVGRPGRHARTPGGRGARRRAAARPAARARRHPAPPRPRPRRRRAVARRGPAHRPRQPGGGRRARGRAPGAWRSRGAGRGGVATRRAARQPGRSPRRVRGVRRAARAARRRGGRRRGVAGRGRRRHRPERAPRARAPGRAARARGPARRAHRGADADGRRGARRQRRATPAPGDRAADARGRPRRAGALGGGARPRRRARRGAGRARARAHAARRLRRGGRGALAAPRRRQQHRRQGGAHRAAGPAGRDPARRARRRDRAVVRGARTRRQPHPGLRRAGPVARRAEALPRRRRRAGEARRPRGRARRRRRRAARAGPLGRRVGGPARQPRRRGRDPAEAAASRSALGGGPHAPVAAAGPRRRLGQVHVHAATGARARAHRRRRGRPVRAARRGGAPGLGRRGDRA